MIPGDDNRLASAFSRTRRCSYNFGHAAENKYNLRLRRVMYQIVAKRNLIGNSKSIRAGKLVNLDRLKENPFSWK